MKKTRGWRDALLWVLCIFLLGCLVLCLIAAFTSFRWAYGTPAQSQAKIDINEINRYLGDYWEAHGEYPPDSDLENQEGLLILMEWEWKGEDDPRAFKLRDPWGTPFSYQRTASNRYVVGSYGPDRKPGDGASDGSRFGDGDDIVLPE